MLYLSVRCFGFYYGLFIILVYLWYGFAITLVCYGWLVVNSCFALRVSFRWGLFGIDLMLLVSRWVWCLGLGWMPILGCLLGVCFFFSFLYF